MSDFLIDEELLAAIDMGSNSFHLAIARVDHGELQKVARMKRKNEQKPHSSVVWPVYLALSDA